jgi:hypothetical protein
VNLSLLLEEIIPMSNILTNSVAALLLGAALPLTSISAPSTDANVAIRGQLQRY